MLKRRLHGLLVQAAIEARGEEAESDVDDEGGAACAAAPPCGPARRQWGTFPGMVPLEVIKHSPE